MVLSNLSNRVARGYKPIFDSIFNTLSPTLRNTTSGRKLKQKLQDVKIVSVGNTFPTLLLTDLHDSSLALNFTHTGNKYTLVDFWYSHCAPCKSQFPKFKELYSTYNAKGFEIIGISIDNDSLAIRDWRKVIADMEIPWKQYRDKDQYNAKKFFIAFYPTNFLLDEKGRIVKRNIRPEELEKLLSNN